MAESVSSPLSRWRYGIHPHATEMRIRAIGRVFLQLGEALRLEMMNTGPDGDDIVHLQYYIATELGPWVLWLSCSRADLRRRGVPPGAHSSVRRGVMDLAAHSLATWIDHHIGADDRRDAPIEDVDLEPGPLG